MERTNIFQRILLAHCSKKGNKKLILRKMHIENFATKSFIKMLKTEIKKQHGDNFEVIKKGSSLEKLIIKNITFVNCQFNMCNFGEISFRDCLFVDTAFKDCIGLSVSFEEGIENRINTIRFFSSNIDELSLGCPISILEFVDGFVGNIQIVKHVKDVLLTSFDFSTMRIQGLAVVECISSTCSTGSILLDKYAKIKSFVSADAFDENENEEKNLRIFKDVTGNY